MITFDDGVKYIGLIAVVYFVVKAFVHDKITNKQTYLLVMIITVPIIALAIHMSQKKCNRRDVVRERQIYEPQFDSLSFSRTPGVVEPFQITDPPITSSIYPGPLNADPVLGKVNIPQTPPAFNFPEVAGIENSGVINKQNYQGLIAQEERAKDNIRQSWTNEMIFTESNPLNTIPLGSQVYQMTYLPPENWFRGYDTPPVCIMDRPSVVNAIGEGNQYADLMEVNPKSAIMQAGPFRIGAK